MEESIMKKALAIILTLILGLSILTACSGPLEDPPPLPSPRVRGGAGPVVPAPTMAPVPSPLGPGPVVGSDDIIPGTGGEFNVQGPGSTEFIFVPNQSGLWEISTFYNGDSDPYLELYGGDFGGLITEDDDSNGAGNAIILWVLDGGAEYKINARFYSDTDAGSYTLTVRLLNADEISSTGGTYQVTEETYFMFTPATAGIWVFETSNNGDGDPKLWIYDENGRYLDDNDDGGEGSNARISIRLTAGTQYFIRAGYFLDFIDTYTLTVTAP